MPRTVTGFVLAGGQSKRMGREKPLLEVGGVTLIERVISVVAPLVEELSVVTNRPDLYGFLGRATIADAVLGRGPLGAMLAVHRSLRTPSAFIVAADYPFLTPEAVGLLLETEPRDGVVLPVIGGMLHPLCAHYGASALAGIEDSLRSGELMVRSFVARITGQIALTENAFGGRAAAERIFTNVNTPEELVRAEETLASAGPR